MECKICGYDGRCFLVEVAYRFDGLMDMFGYVTAEGQAVETLTTVRCPDCHTAMPTLTGEFDEEA